MPTGVYEHKSKQFCSKGHNKYLPHGMYVFNDRARGTVMPCGVCHREKARLHVERMNAVRGPTRCLGIAQYRNEQCLDITRHPSGLCWQHRKLIVKAETVDAA